MTISLVTNFRQWQDLYFIQAGEDGPVKVGVSRNPRRRLTTMQTATWTELELLLVLEGAGDIVEARLHRRFAKQKIRGEWYRFCGPVQGFYNDCGRLANSEFDEVYRGTLLTRATYSRLSESTFSPIEYRLSPYLERLMEQGARV